MKSTYSAGQIIMVDLGELHEIRGHEQANYRPCVVIKPFAAFKMAIVVPVTSSTKLNYYTVVPLLKGSGGLSTDSYALCHQIRAISFERITDSIGKLDNRDFLKIQSVLADTLELS